ncbi:invasion regulator SirB1 [Candidatus Williamhamiltonella defendens]|uniref:invasion regulator SirB1 n=1 Tax=Candidatus Williamhamiltonella defendens TaxID=138072 RepID=UPI00130DEB95|nr:invasion regulator SirB1 [Candidatus Hamiltonella defensa]
MRTISNFKFNTATLSEGVFKITRKIRQDFSISRVRKKLMNLVEDARVAIPEHLNQDQKLELLIDLFYHQWKFEAADGIYRTSDVIWLDNVLKIRQGTATSLGVIFLHIAHQLDIPLMPVLFPIQLIFRADWLAEEMSLINPINGDTLNKHILELWVKAHFNQNIRLEDSDLCESDNTSLIRQMLDELKSALIEEKQMELALRTSDMSLFFDPKDPYEIRDRGLIYAELGCTQVAISDLNYFIEQCPEDPISEVIKIQLNAIEKQPFILH